MTSSAPFDIGALVASAPGVYGGRPCLAGTRFPILQLAVLHNDGLTAEEIVERWAGLDLARVYAGIAYYYANKVAIDAELAEEQRDYDFAAAAEKSARRASA